MGYFFTKSGCALVSEPPTPDTLLVIFSLKNGELKNKHRYCGFRILFLKTIHSDEPSLVKLVLFSVIQTRFIRGLILHTKMSFSTIACFVDPISLPETISGRLKSKLGTL